MSCPWCNKFMFLQHNFCPRCGNDLKGAIRPTEVSEKNLKKREIWMQKELKRGEKTIADFNKHIEKWEKRDIKKKRREMTEEDNADLVKKHG